jgi:outer membrane protein assembly factor BamB
LLWRFFTDGPVRFAPAGLDGRIYFVSDDGFLYCVGAGDGELIWKVNGGPAERKIIGNGRLISSWPARGGPVVADGNVYFAASIWSFMGIFVHAVDARSGEIIWTNSGDGTNFTTQPHGGAVSFATVVPQGHLVVSGDDLVVPGGRSTPGVFDLATGRLKHFVFDKKHGDHHVMAGQDLYYVAGGAYDMETGKRIANERPLLADRDVLVFEADGSVYGLGADAERRTKTVQDRKGNKQTVTNLVRETLFAIGLREGPSKLFIKAGNHVYAAGGGKVAAYDVTGPKGERRPTWIRAVEGTVHHMLAADRKLFVVTEEGRIHCFGTPRPGSSGKVRHSLPIAAPLATPEGPDPCSTLVEELRREQDFRHGYGLALGIASGRLIAEVLRIPDLPLVVLDGSAEKVDLLRQRCDQAGLYGVRLAAHVGEISTTSLPPYFASLIVCENPVAAGIEPGDREVIERMFQALRPYGGMAVFPSSREQHEAIASLVADADGLEQARLSWKDGITRLTREGALPGSDDWSHQYANAAQTAISRDKLVKAPLGVLWFGGPSHEGILPRHGHGPSPQVAGGRLFIEGPDMLRAVDVYTGRVIWERDLPGFGTYYNKTAHFAGAGEIGSNYVSLPDRIYAVHDTRIVELDAATGKTLKSLTLDEERPEGERAPYWGYIGVRNDCLIATSSPVEVIVHKGTNNMKPKPEPKKQPDFLEMLREHRYASGSRRLIVHDRHTGKLLWKRDAAFVFRHNNIAVSDNTVFCIDAFSKGQLPDSKAVIGKSNALPTLHALDLTTGRELWTTTANVFGTFLNYSAEHDILLQAGSRYRDRAKDEVGQGMVAYRGRTGEVIWENLEVNYGGPCLLWHDRVITNGDGGFALDLLTGKKTGWSYHRKYGCNTAVGSEHLLTFRSGAAGFYDMADDGGTGNFGGFRSSCTANLIAANGVLNAPDYTRTCTCAYQNQTSLALVHMPEAEFWTFGAKNSPGRIGINFGAPGDRRDSEGTLWTDFPSVGGPSDEVGIAVQPADVGTYRVHSSAINGGGMKWVVASGLIGASSIELPADGDRPWRVRLFFAEPDESTQPGERMMHVSLQGRPVLKSFDVVKEAGGPRRPLSREFEATPKNGAITIGFTGLGSRPTLISGVEIKRE